MRTQPNITSTLVCFCLLSLLFNTVQAKTSPLLNHVYTLQCAKDEATAEKAVEKLRTAPMSAYGLPMESLHTPNTTDTSDKYDKLLTAGSLDITLNTLVQTVEKYPTLQRLIERTLLRWNYCQVFENGIFYDVIPEQPRHQATYLAPLKWQGFKRLGFLNPDATFTPKLLTESPLGKRAFEAFFHRIYRQHCFPHPTTGKMYHRQHSVSPRKIVHNKTTKNTTYPYRWNESCTIKKVLKKPVKKVKKIIVKKILKPTKKKKIKKKVVQKPKPIKKKKKITPPAPGFVKQPVIKKPALVTVPVVAKKPKKRNQPKPIVMVVKKAKKKQISKPKAKPVTTVPRKKQTLTKIAIVPSGGSTAPIPTVISENPEKTYGFTGNFYIKQSLAGNHPTIGGTASWKPIADSYWFIRGSIDYDHLADEDPLIYSWGLGYDDWHQDTWSFQINNWGPIKPEEGLAFDKAIANIGYKFKSDTLEKYKLSANTSLDIPIDGDQVFNLGMQWSPKENWYIRANVHQPLNGDDPKWSYGFGYSNWRPNKINVEYANYGPNDLFDTNFQKNGTVSVSYTWEF